MATWPMPKGVAVSAGAAASSVSRVAVVLVAKAASHSGVCWATGLSLVVAPEDGEVHEALAEGVPGECGPAFGAWWGEERGADEAVEVFADGEAVEHRGAVVEDEGRDLAEGVVGEEVGVGAGHEDDGADGFDAVGDAELVGGYHDLADEGRRVQFHR